MLYLWLYSDLALCIGPCLLNALAHFISFRMKVIKFQIVVQVEPHTEVRSDIHSIPLTDWKRRTLIVAPSKAPG